MFSCHRNFRHGRLSSSHALGTKTLSANRATALLDLQLLSTPAKARDSPFARMFRIVTGTGAPVLRALRVRLRRDARTRTSAGRRTGTRLLSADAAVTVSWRLVHSHVTGGIPAATDFVAASDHAFEIRLHFADFDTVLARGAPYRFHRLGRIE